MKKVLVPTDLSANSISGIRFAIRWASQQPLELVYVYVLNLRSSKSPDEDFEKYAAGEEQVCREKFEIFINNLYEEIKQRPENSSFLILRGVSPDITLIDHCRSQNDIDYICISTRGAGGQNKVLGTNTGNLITKSPVPVIAVPLNYKESGLTSVLYATDLKNLDEEMGQVVEFAKPLRAMIEAVHLTKLDKIKVDPESINSEFRKKFDYDLTLYFEENNEDHSLTENLQDQIQLRKPSLVIMFTNQKRTFFQKWFLFSRSEQLSFEVTVPLLVFNKK